MEFLDKEEKKDIEDKINKFKGRSVAESVEVVPYGEDPKWVK